MALIDIMRRNIELGSKNVRKGRLYWLKSGKAWLGIKSHPLLDEIGGIKALKPLLPHYPQWLN